MFNETFSRGFLHLFAYQSSLHSFIIMSFTSANGWSDNIKGENIYYNCTTECFESEDVLTKWKTLRENPFFIAICEATRNANFAFESSIFQVVVSLQSHKELVSVSLSLVIIYEILRYSLWFPLTISRKTLKLNGNFQVSSIFRLHEQPWIPWLTEQVRRRRTTLRLNGGWNFILINSDSSASNYNVDDSW